MILKFKTHPDPKINYKGKIAISSDGKVVLWNPNEKNILLRTDDWGAMWTTSTGISAQKCFPTADPVNPDVFYAFNSGVYKSTDKGKSFVKVGGATFSWTTDMQVSPGREGHVWVAGYAWDGINGGFLAKSIDGGKSFVNIDPQSDSIYTQKIQHCEAIGFGKEAPGQSYPAIYIYGTINNVKGIWQSIDEAKTWVRIDDDKHQFGALSNGNFVRGDANIFGVVYRSTAGRGIAVRYPNSMVNVVNDKQSQQDHSLFRLTNPNNVSNGRVDYYTIDGRMIASVPIHNGANYNKMISGQTRGVFFSVRKDGSGKIAKVKKVQVGR
jgi:hypothetical protein